MDLEQLLRVPYVDPDYDFSISPDGREVAFSWNASGQWEIYVVPLSAAAQPRKITSGPGAKFAPRWSPDGTRLAYVLDSDGGEQFDIHVYDTAMQRHTNLTPHTPYSIQPSYAWAPDGSQIALLSDQSGHFETYVMSSAGGPAHLLLSLPFPAWQVRWSPDGHWLCTVVQATGQDFAAYLTSVDGQSVRSIGVDGDWIPAKDPSWSPDSRRIAFSSDVRGALSIGLFELAAGELTWLTEGVGDKQQPTWSPDGRRLAYIISQGPVTELAVLDLAGKRVSAFQLEPGVHYRPRFTPNGDHLVFIFDNPRHPDDLWLLSLRPGSDGPQDARSARQLTCSLPPNLKDAVFAMPVEVRYRSLDDQSVPALLYGASSPGDWGVGRRRGPGPAIVYVHGGPDWLAQVTWDPLVQHMVGRGWSVLAPNYRGSTGYGRQWQLANRFDLGGADTEDVVAGADYLIREGLADPAHIAVTGRSYGGYLTMTSLTKYPERWAAGSAVVPFLNWFTSHANSRQDLQHWDLENFGHPERDHVLFTERSPFFFLDRVTAPVQLICGANDPRCPASESTQAYEALLALGKECDLVLYHDEGHQFHKIRNVVDHKKRLVAFLAEALENPELRKPLADSHEGTAPG